MKGHSSFVFGGFADIFRPHKRTTQKQQQHDQSTKIIASSNNNGEKHVAFRKAQNLTTPSSSSSMTASSYYYIAGGADDVDFDTKKTKFNRERWNSSASLPPLSTTNVRNRQFSLSSKKEKLSKKASLELRLSIVPSEEQQQQQQKQLSSGLMTMSLYDAVFVEDQCPNTPSSSSTGSGSSCSSGYSGTPRTLSLCGESADSGELLLSDARRRSTSGSCSTLVSGTPTPSPWKKSRNSAAQKTSQRDSNDDDVLVGTQLGQNSRGCRDSGCCVSATEELGEEDLDTENLSPTLSSASTAVDNKKRCLDRNASASRIFLRRMGEQREKWLAKSSRKSQHNGGYNPRGGSTIYVEDENEAYLLKLVASRNTNIVVNHKQQTFYTMHVRMASSGIKN